jgi:hypothetical protein
VKLVLLASLTLTALTTSACANGPCRQLREPQLAAQQQRDQTATEAAAVTSTSGTSIASNNSGANAVNRGVTSTPSSTVLVYKADGSQQCGQNKGLSAEEMEKKELSALKVLSRTKKADGMMHIQTCGAVTGMINVYEIAIKDLKRAESKGFKKLEKAE